MTQWNLPISYEFKHDEDAMLITLLSPILVVLMSEIILYFKIHKMPLVITRTIDKKIKGVSTSDIHSDARAFDVSCRGLSKEFIKKTCNHFNKKYGKWLGTSKTGKNNRVCVYEDGITAGKGEHLHWQVKRNIDLEQFYKDFFTY